MLQSTVLIIRHSASKRNLVAAACVNATNDIQCATHGLNAIIALKNTAHTSQREEYSLNHVYPDIQFFDIVTGKTLCHTMAVDAKKLELKLFWKMIMYMKVLKNKAYANDGIKKYHEVVQHQQGRCSQPQHLCSRCQPWAEIQ